MHVHMYVHVKTYTCKRFGSPASNPNPKKLSTHARRPHPSTPCTCQRFEPLGLRSQVRRAARERKAERERDSAKFNYTIHTIQSNQDQSISRIDIHSSRHSFLTAGQLLREQFDPKSILSVSRATAPLPCKT